MRVIVARMPGRARVLGLAISAMLLLASCGGDDGVGLSPESYSLEPVNDSGYSGEAVVTSPGSGASQIIVAIGREDVPESDFPVAIQDGTCEGLGGSTVQDLGQLQSGLLVTQVPMTLDSLRAADHALVVFQSGDRQVYVACADF